MRFPFTSEQFFELFAAYNNAIWPVQLVAYALGLGALGLVLLRHRWARRAAPLSLAALWIWIGAVYHVGFFAKINPVAPVFGGMFIVQGLVFAYLALKGAPPILMLTRSPTGVMGLVLIFYALVVYPLLGYRLSHIYPANPVFGVTPCPTSIFTFGLLLWSQKRLSALIFLIPILWSAVATSAAIHFGVKEDFGLTLAGAISVFSLIACTARWRLKASGLAEGARPQR